MVLHSSHDQLIMEITELRNSSKNKRIGTELTKSKLKERIRFSSSAVLNIISNTPPCLGAANSQLCSQKFEFVDWQWFGENISCLFFSFAVNKNDTPIFLHLSQKE